MALKASRFLANGSFGGVTCGVRVVAVAVETKSNVRSIADVCSGTLTQAIVPHDELHQQTRKTSVVYLGPDGVGIRGRGYVKISGASTIVTAYWRNL